MTFLLPLLLLAAAAPAPVHEDASLPALPAPSSTTADVPRPLRLTFGSTSAFGVTNGRFFNQLLAARIDYRFTSRFAFGASLAYANLKGKDRRVHGALPEIWSEYRAPLRGETLGLPLRLGLGYLTKNGPTLRVGAGLHLALSNRVSLELVPLEPMIWLSRERPEVSFNASVGLGVAF